MSNKSFFSIKYLLLSFLPLILPGVCGAESKSVTIAKSTYHIYFILLATTVILLIISIIILVLHKKKIIADKDNITGISTFSTFEKHLQKTLKNAKPNEYLILSFNVDKFRFINETYGVIVGNKVLRRLARNFVSHCKPNEAVCRFYADNFIFFMKSPDFFWSIEERVFTMTCVEDAIKDLIHGDYNLDFTTSVYYIDKPDSSVESMIDKANLAQKLCKNNYATHRVIEYTAEMNEAHEWNREITLTMDKAIENMEFEVFFQPKFKFEDESVIGAEALIRWNNPRKGFLQPAKFVPLFEDNGFIEKIDKYVLKKVCIFLDDWNKSPESKNHAPLTISFNLSRCHLYNTNLIKELKDIASQYEIGDNKIEVELTESVMFDNQQRLIKMMGEIKKAGFGVSVDDFGAGYSSLNLLKNMPADVIKLDKEFLSGGPENIKENVIITSVIEMAKKLNITTVAEGVETKTQCDLLKNIGCDIAQGFYYAKPMPQSNFRELLVNSTLAKQNKKSLT